MLEIRHLATNGTREPFKVILNEYFMKIRLSALKKYTFSVNILLITFSLNHSIGIKKIELFKLNRKNNTELL